MILKNKRHIIFDWNGTLVDDAWVFVEVLNTILIERNLKPINLDQYQSLFCFPIKKFYQRLGVDTSIHSYEIIEQTFKYEYNRRLYKPNLFPSTIKTLVELNTKKIDLSILSASNQNTLNKLVAFYKIDSFFHNIVGVENYEALGKKDAGMKLIEKINCNKKDIVLIGDTDYDYSVAKKLNIDCILIPNGHQSIERLIKTSGKIKRDLFDIINCINSDCQ